MKSWNPLAFRPKPVSVILTVVYAAFLTALLVVHHVLPSTPGTDVPVAGINISEAFLDLQRLSVDFHPYGSRRNDEARTWILARIDEILKTNGADVRTVWSPVRVPHELAAKGDEGGVEATVFDDMISNVSFTLTRFGTAPQSTYFEGSNVIVYLRGEEDALGPWWRQTNYSGQKGVMVNAHYDSVSTGYGATDDGVGVISMLQLLSFFSRKTNRPKHGIVFLFNNGEENYLNGARAFAQHPTSGFVDRFLNLEGAGAGGRAALFRSTDAEVTKFYGRSRYPFGTSTSDDGFKRGLVRSETDYRVFTQDLNMRGLDVAFLEPRARYHTTEDNTRNTRKGSIWHMLSAALPTMQGLTEASLESGSGVEAVWFDLFGRTFVLMELHTLFALQVTLLVIAPIPILAIVVGLSAKEKLYPFHRRGYIGDARVPLGGWKGFFRPPIIFAISSGCTVGVAFLITRFNRFIAMSSPWSVWASLVSVWIFAAWFQSRFSDYVRPTALTRAFTLAWLHFGIWVLAVASAALENRGMSSPYPILFYQLGLWLATMIALLELLPVPKMSRFVAEQLEIPANTPENADVEPNADEEPTERTALLNDQPQSFRPRSRRTEEFSTSQSDERPAGVYGYEQHWSGALSSWLWSLEFLLASIPALLFVGQLATFLTSSLAQTLSDGNSALVLYLSMAVLSVLLAAPLQPFVHRCTYHIPVFLLLVLVGTLIYNLVAFPFSPNNKLKIYFAQEVDLDSGLNNVLLRGADVRLISEAAGTLPSSAGHTLNVTHRSFRGTFEVRWPGIPPTVVQPVHPDLPPEITYEHWIKVNASRSSKHGHSGTIFVWGNRTQNCKLVFDTPISNFYVEGSTTDNGIFPSVPHEGSSELRLWRRAPTDEGWTVQVSWGGQKGLDGRAVCLWNEQEDQPDGGIPALREFRHFAPAWAAVEKNSDGLVEGSKSFMM